MIAAFVTPFFIFGAAVHVPLVQPEQVFYQCDDTGRVDDIVSYPTLEYKVTFNCRDGARHSIWIEEKALIVAQKGH